MKFTAKELSVGAVCTALVFVVTRSIQIPIPLGYLNVGNTVILMACMLLPAPLGVFAASVGSALADLTSYPVYTLPTLIIKAAFPLVFYMICRSGAGRKGIRMIAAAVSTIIPLVGYTLTGALIYGSLITGLAQFPGLLVEYVANLILFSVIAVPTARLARATAAI